MISSHCQWKWFRSTELSARFHTPEAEPRLDLAAHCYTLVTTSRLRRCFDRVQNQAGRWDKSADLAQLYWILLVCFLLVNKKSSVKILTSQSAASPWPQKFWPHIFSPQDATQLKPQTLIGTRIGKINHRKAAEEETICSWRVITVRNQIKVCGVYIRSVGRAPVVYSSDKPRKAESVIKCSQLYITTRAGLEERLFSHHPSVSGDVALHANGAFLQLCILPALFIPLLCLHSLLTF